MIYVYRVRWEHNFFLCVVVLFSQCHLLHSSFLHCVLLAVCWTSFDCKCVGSLGSLFCFICLCIFVAASCWFDYIVVHFEISWCDDCSFVLLPIPSPVLFAWNCFGCSGSSVFTHEWSVLLYIYDFFDKAYIESVNHFG